MTTRTIVEVVDGHNGIFVHHGGVAFNVWPCRDVPPGVDPGKWFRLVGALHARVDRERTKTGGAFIAKGCTRWSEYKALVNANTATFIKKRGRRHHRSLGRVVDFTVG